MDTRWSCGPLSTGESSFRPPECEVDFSLNYYRYVRQIKLGESFPVASLMYVWCCVRRASQKVLDGRILKNTRTRIIKAGLVFVFGAADFYDGSPSSLLYSGSHNCFPEAQREP